MKMGDSGEKVKEIQRLLIKNGATITADGEFGEKTAFAVKRFQQDHGLVADGVVGPKTIEVLEGNIKEIVTEKPLPVFDGSLDVRTEKNVKSLDPKAAEIFIPFIKEAKVIAANMGYSYVAISGNRTEAEQNAIYAQGRTRPGKVVTNARYPYSNHNHRIALDFGVFKDGRYIDESRPAESEKVHRAVAKLCEKYSIDWGGAWTGKLKDFPHFEIRTGLTMAEKIKRMREKGSVF